MMPRHRRESGFTLLEVIVAFAIAAVALAALSQAFSTGLRQVDRIDATTAALMLAQEKIAEIDAAQTLEVGTQSGTTPRGGAWQVIVEPLGNQETASILFDVDVRAEFDGAVVELRTIRMGAVP
jgi:general secretion pathway protein I